MADKIKLKICLPGEIFKEFEVEKVQLPAFAGDITILPERAPTVFILKSGFIRFVYDKNKYSYYIKSGIADCFEAICKVMTEDVIDFKDIKIDEYIQKVNDARTDEEKNLYKDMVELIKLEKMKEI